MDDIFEKCFFSKIKKGFRKKKHTALSFDSTEFNQEVSNNLLNFEDLRKKDKKASIVQMKKGYRVKLSKPHLAFNMGAILSHSNPGIDLKFSEDLLEYEPDEELIVKSSVPLWVIKPVDGGSTVSIQRVW
jgi:hypothetical protein